MTTIEKKKERKEKKKMKEGNMVKSVARRLFPRFYINQRERISSRLKPQTSQTRRAWSTTRRRIIEGSRLLSPDSRWALIVPVNKIRSVILKVPGLVIRNSNFGESKKEDAKWPLIDPWHLRIDEVKVSSD